jgi:hypothetical protein
MIIADPNLCFRGQSNDWTSFDKKMKDTAKMAIPGRSFGILGALVTIEEYAIFDAAGAPYVALVDPGERPIIGIQNPTTVQQSAFANIVKVWEFALENYIKQEDANTKFKTNYLSYLDENSRRLVDHPINGTMTITIREMRNILKREFGTLSPTDVDKIFDKATSSYSSGMDMREFLYSKVQSFAELASVGEVYGVQATTRYLILSFKSVGTYDEVIAFWQNTHTTVESQVQNAPSLSSALITAYNKNKDLTTGARANSATTTNPVITMENIEKRIAAGIVAGIAAAAKEAASDAHCATCKAKVTGKNKAGRPLKYCAKCFAKFKADQAVT